MKLQLKIHLSRTAPAPGAVVDEPSASYKESTEKRGHGTEHPCWRYFTRDRKSADCRICGVHVAYACSGNLMRHLRSRHVAESVITQKEWEEIQKVAQHIPKFAFKFLFKKKKQLCELRLMASANSCGSEEQSPSNGVSYSCGDEEQGEGMAGAGEDDDVNGLIEELASFPMQKSLLCMRRIRKFMDEQLLELDENVQNSEDDASIS
ncbi:unnamed protein product [Gongylonema pulchrum]|uniref:BED-type domain-containing protein n=1 Tax=Gongylonema pulchrum TaxID=637853 RepID=A0A183DTG9_9BILA|nr:unnamed protein product [Gongylonema pulchrum]